VVIAVVDEDLTVKRIRMKDNNVFLAPENGNYPNIQLERDMIVEIWRVVTNVIHKL